MLFCMPAILVLAYKPVRQQVSSCWFTAIGTLCSGSEAMFSDAEALSVSAILQVMTHWGDCIAL